MIYFLIMPILSLAIDHNSAAGQDRRWVRNMNRIRADIPAPFPIDIDKVEQAGLRIIESKHLTLYTDILPNGKIDALPELFDRCVPQWCQHFDVDPDQARLWKMRGFLISDRSAFGKFRQAGLVPADLPDFLAGYQTGHDFWWFLQPGQYYTRHLMIHEGTHAFMQWFLGGYGAPWFSEGLAELFGSNRLSDGNLTIRYRIQDRSEAEYWGRVKRIRDERGTANEMSLEDVLDIQANAFRQVRNYGWSWAACDFFSQHELTRKAFRELKNRVGKVSNTAFNQSFKSAVARHWQALERDWQIFLSEIDYGYEIERGRLIDAEVIQSDPIHQKVKIRTDQSWQMTGLKVRAGERFSVNAKGQFQVGSTQTEQGQVPWISEANGVTIEYYQGAPLGILKLGILDDTQPSAKQKIAGLIDNQSFGKTKTWVAKQSGMLCLRINESPAHLEDNFGTLEVTLEKLK
ncbi:MAG: hypothetical protein AAF623_20770 [Planctomycetota bacterium]